jgi:hypothetical protein
MPKHVYLRAYMAGGTVPSVLMMFILVVFCVLRFGYRFPVPIERGLVFPMALVPNFWGLWNMLYVRLRRSRPVNLGLFGAAVPLFVGPLAFLSAMALDFEIPMFVKEAFVVTVILAIGAYYLVWKYVMGFFNRVLEIE